MPQRGGPQPKERDRSPVAAGERHSRRTFERLSAAPEGSRGARAARLATAGSAAQSLWQAKNYFGELYRRWKARLGSPKAITAMAHKLARILWHLLKFKEPFKPEVFAKEEEKMKRKKLARLQNMAASLNYQLVPQP